MNNILNVIIKYYKYSVNVSSLYDYYLQNRNQVTFIGISNFDIIKNTLSDQNVMYTEKKSPMMISPIPLFQLES